MIRSRGVASSPAPCWAPIISRDKKGGARKISRYTPRNPTQRHMESLLPPHLLPTCSEHGLICHLFELILVIHANTSNVTNNIV
jgi:hypothetical protein